MLKKMLLAASCVAGICGICNGMQLKTIDEIIDAPVSLGKRLAAFGGALVENHNEIYTFEVTNKKDAEAIIDIFLEEGRKYADNGKLKEANLVVLLLKNPDDVFCFESSYEMGKFSSKEEYLKLEKYTYDVSEKRATELEKIIVTQCTNYNVQIQ